jgi:hypothetical protein
VLREQLEHLLEVARLRHVDIQVMPTSHGDHPGMGGRVQVIKFGDGTAVGRADNTYDSRPKGSYRSNRDGNDCVEVAITPAIVHVRDSKRPDGPRLAVTRAAWAGFVAGTGKG